MSCSVDGPLELGIGFINLRCDYFKLVLRDLSRIYSRSQEVMSVSSCGGGKKRNHDYR